MSRDVETVVQQPVTLTAILARCASSCALRCPFGKGKGNPMAGVGIGSNPSGKSNPFSKGRAFGTGNPFGIIYNPFCKGRPLGIRRGSVGMETAGSTLELEKFGSNLELERLGTSLCLKINLAWMRICRRPLLIITMDACGR